MVSFKISKVGSRYTPKPKPQDVSHVVLTRNPLPHGLTENCSEVNHLVNGTQFGTGIAAVDVEQGNELSALSTGSELASLSYKLAGSNLANGPNYTPKKRGEVTHVQRINEMVGLNRSRSIAEGDQLQRGVVSFALNLFLDGFSIGCPTQKGKSAPRGCDFTESTYPYDRTSECFIRAIDAGLLPSGDLLEDIPCTYVDGCVVCEVREYRDSGPSRHSDALSWIGMPTEWVPTVRKVLLKPSAETVIKDVAAMADKSWTYEDVLKVEGQILKAIQPPLCLDPSPEVAKIAWEVNYNKTKFNIGLPLVGRYKMQKEARADRRRRLAVAATTMPKIGNLSDLQQISGERVSDKSTSGSCIDYHCLQDGTGTGLASGGGLGGRGILSQHQSGHGLAGQTNGGRLGPSFPSAIMIPSLPVPSSPSSSAPATPATPSTVTSANESSGFPGDMKPGSVSSVPAKRDSKEFAAPARSEAKKVKLNGKIDKYNQHQKQEAKHAKELLRKEKSQPQQYHLGKHLGGTEMTSELPTSQTVSLDTVSHSDFKGFGQSDQDHLAFKSMEMEVSNPTQDCDQHTYNDSEKLTSEWARAEVAVKVEPAGHDHVLQSDPVDEHLIPQGLRVMHPPQFPVSGPAQGLHWQQVGHMMEAVPGLKTEIDVKQEEMLAQPTLKMSPNIMKMSPTGHQMHMPGVMKSSPLPISSVALPLGATPASIGAGSSGISTVGVPMSIPLTSSPSGTTSRSPVQAVPNTFSSPGAPGQLDPMLQSPQFSALSAQALRRRSNSLPKIQSAPSPSSYSSSMPSPMLNSPSTGSASLSSPNVKGDHGLSVPQGTASQNIMGTLGGQRKPPSNDPQAALLKVITSLKGKTPKKREQTLPPPSTNPPSFQLLAVALSNNTTEDYKEATGRQSMANSLVGGNINARKTRYLQFHRSDHVHQGPGYAPLLVRSRTRLVLCGRGKDTMVEAVIQMSDDQDDDAQQTAPPHHVLPIMANPDKADQFASQYATLMEKEGWELLEDQVQGAVNRGVSAMTNAASNARPMPAGATTLGNTASLAGSSPRMSMNQQHMASLPGTGISPLSQMQPPSPNTLAAARMPPPANSARPMITNHLGQTVSGKPLQMDTASQITAAHQQQQQQRLQNQHQLQLQQQQQQQQQQQNSRPQQLVATQHQLVAQLSAHNNNQQMSHPNQLQQLQYLQHQHQQRQQQQQQQMTLQRKMMLPGGMSNLPMGMSGGNNMTGMNGVGLPGSGGQQGGIGNVVGLSGLNGVSGMNGMGGMTNPMGGMSGLTNMGQLPNMGNMGQTGGVSNILNPQMRPGTMNQVHAQNAAAVLASKRMVGRGRTPGSNGSPVRGTMDNLPMVPANQMHGTGGVPMMGQSMSRNGLTPIQRAPANGMALPKSTSVMSVGSSGQGYYINPQQLSAQQMTSGGLGSLVGGPPSPQMGSQVLGTLPGMVTSAMDMQNVTRAGTLAAVTAAGRGQMRRSLVAPQAQTGQPGQSS